MDRLPAYPLFVKDPYYSLWSSGEILNESAVIFWTGAEKPMEGKIAVGGAEYTFLGKGGENKLKQVSRKVTAFTTEYEFEHEDFQLCVSFVSPLPLDDLKILSCPVCYLDYKIVAKKPLGQICVSFCIDEKVCYDTSKTPERKEDCRANVIKLDKYEVAYVGLRTQGIMQHASDGFGADWGYYYLTGETCDVIQSGDEKRIVAQNVHNVESQVNGQFMLAFDDVASIYYYGEVLRGYYFEGRTNIFDALQDSYENKEKIYAKLQEFENCLKAKTQGYSENYYHVLVGSLRQSIGAHKLVKDHEGRVLFISKECNSDGCAATVDVTYPSAPLYLLYNTELVKGMLRPVFDFARMPIWEYDFAPHDVGMYPYVTGQLYAVDCGRTKYNQDVYVNFSKKEVLPFYYLMRNPDEVYNPDRQMPVEESANMLLLAYACYLMDGDFAFIEEHFDLLSKWGEYLIKNGPEYGRQLCTDDFAGHLVGNMNLAIKATIALGVYAKIMKIHGQENEANRIQTIAEEFASKIESERCEDGHLPIAFGAEKDTYSLKYNLIFDQLMKTNLFNRSIGESEAKYYEKLFTGYGVPLDSRLRETKSDWMIWSAGISENKEYRDKIIDEVAAFMKKGTQRYPFPDWYNVDTAEAKAFRNRTVVGGHFILLLKDSLEK